MASVGGMFGLIVFGSILLALLIPVVIIWAIVEVARNVSGGGHRSVRYDPAADALRYRFARGEITQAEFESGMRALGYEKR